MHGLHGPRINARPDDVAVLAAVFDMEDDCARLAGKAKSK
jgi:hypothetical protein